MYICVCKGITEQQVIEKSRTLKTTKEILKSLGVGSDCGTCLTYAVEQVQQKLNQSAPIAAKSK